MSHQIPKHWVSATIGKVFQTVGGGTPSTGRPEFWGEGIPWITSADIDEFGSIKPRRAVTESGIVSSATNPVPPKSVIVVTRVGLGKVGVAKEDLCFSQDCQALLFDPTLLAPSFVAHQVRHTVRGIRGRGTTIAGVTIKQLQDLSFRLPPYREQQRIAETLDSYLTRLDDIVGTLEHVQAKLKAYRASILKAAVEGRLIPIEASLARAEKRDYEPAEVLLVRILEDRRRRWEAAELARLKSAGKTPKDEKWKAKYREPVVPDTKNLPKLPEGWCWASPDQLSSTDSYSLGIGPFGSNLKVSDYAPKGTPLIFVRNIRAEAFEERDGAHYISDKKTAELRPHQVTPGDILVTKMGDPPGDCCLYPLSRPVGVITADCIKLRLHRYLTCANFFVHSIRSGVVQNQIQQMTRGVAQKKVSLARFRRLAIPLPPVSEQERIAVRVDTLLSVSANILSEMGNQLHRCARLRQTILKWAFEGKLVDQDASDEPAEKLLDRIAAERDSDDHVRLQLNGRSRGEA